MHEHSVIAALAELERLEQDRVGDERRRAAEQKLRAIEREVERRFGERFEHERGALHARLASAHAAREALLEQRIGELRAELVAANAARDTLREALTALAGTQPDAAPHGTRARRGVLFAALALAALAATYGARMLGTHATPDAAHASVASALHALEPAAPAAVVATAPQALPQPQPQAAPSQATPAPRPRPAVHRGGAGARPHTASSAATDPLGPIDGCGDDPTCGL